MIKVLFYPILEMGVLRLQMTESEIQQFQSFSTEQKVRFIIDNIPEDEIKRLDEELLHRMYSDSNMSKFTFLKGMCKKCGCTENDPCYHPEFGTCWWENEDMELCSHCANSEISDDLQTKRAKGVVKPR